MHPTLSLYLWVLSMVSKPGSMVNAIWEWRALVGHFVPAPDRTSRPQLWMPTAQSFQWHPHRMQQKYCVLFGAGEQCPALAAAWWEWHARVYMQAGITDVT